MSFPAAIDLRRVRAPRLPKIGVPTTFKRPSGLGLLAALLVLAAVIAGSFLLVRNSSLVAVEKVKIVGLAGYYDKDARAAVTAEAMDMTTWNFDASRIEEAASQFVDVAGVEVDTDFPHAATIRIEVRRPVLIARIGGRTVTLSQTGEVINPTHAVAGLPKIDAPGVIHGDRVTSGKAFQAVTVLGAAPDVLLRKVEAVRWGKMGIVVKVKNGPELYFGDSSDARLKWRDAASVLASENSRGASYLDLRVPGRPAVGGIGGAALTQPTAATSDVAVEPSTGTTTEAPAATQTPATAGEQAPAPVQQTTTPAAGGAAPTG